MRSAIADPSIIEVAQYSPNELAIIGLQVGTTTLTLWFDKSPEPLIYLVNTVRDPSVDERRRTDSPSSNGSWRSSFRTARSI